MKDNMGKDEVSKASLWTDSVEVLFVLGVDLEP